MVKEIFARTLNGSSSDAQNGIDPFTQGFVRKSARQLAGKFGFTEQDRDDIEQRLYLKLTRHFHEADPDDPIWKAFVAKTVRRHLANMIRDNQARKRDHRRARSLHTNIGTEDGPVERAMTVASTDVPSRRASQRRNENDLANLRMDIADAIADLDSHAHRDLCERLKHDSLSQVARDLGIPRTTVDAWRRKVRCRFEDCALEDYLS
jgi:RNA polymerase sigma factor (sigma-70 family)